MAIELYEVNSKYIDYLVPHAPHLFQNKQPEQHNERKYIGIVLNVNNMKYFAPLSSFKLKHEKMKNRLDFIKIENYAVININNMFPVPDGEYTYVNIPKVKNPQYRKLLTTEYRIIRKLQNKIKSNALEVYRHKINKGSATALAKRCNDFILLEEKCRQYNSIRLIEPTTEYEKDIWQFRQEIISSNDKDKFAGCGNLEKCSSAKEWIDTINLHKLAETCPKDKVPSKIFIAVRENDNRIVGIIDLRYHINTPILSTWGGHMGYYVRPAERKKGYAKEMLRQNLQNCKDLNIQKVLITCDADNLASEKTIIANGGIFEKNIEVDGCFIKRYWVTIT